MTMLKTSIAAATLGIVMMAGPLSTAFAQAKANCTCRFAGQNYKISDIVCIRGKLSRCEFVLNNTSWKTVAETCPQASAPGVQQSPLSTVEITIMARMHSQFSLE